MKDSLRHIFLTNTIAFFNDCPPAINRAWRRICILLWFSTPFALAAQHINNGKRLDSLHKSLNASARILTITYNVTGSGSYCSGGVGLPVGLDGSEAEGSYQLQLNGVDAGPPVTGTGNAISFGNQTAAGTYTVIATVEEVSATMNGNAVITINSPPSVTANNTQVCFGNNSVALTGSPSGGTWSGTGVSGSTFTANGLAAGGYPVTYLYTDGNGCSNSAGATVTVNALPTAFASSNSPQCTGSTLNLNASGGSTYSWTGPNGFASGLPNPSITNVSTAASGTYTVTVTDANGCVASTTTNVTITTLPTASINYPGTPFCTTLTGVQPVTLNGTNGYTGGTYSVSPAGLTINSSTGDVTPNTSTPGAYTVTYTIPASGGCLAITATASVTITALPTATISYGGTPFCTTVNTAQAVTLNGTGAYTGGTYSAPAGLTIDPSTGAITPSSSTPGTYTVTYTTPASAGCGAVTATTSVTITALPTASLTYSGSPFCKSVATAQAGTLTGTGVYTGGTYSASPAGLVINSSNGAITPNASTAGTYTVTYTTPTSGGCVAVTTTASVTITAVPVATFSYAGTPYCQNAGNPSPTFSGGGVAGTFSASPAGLVFVSTSTGQVDLTASTPGTYTITNTIAAAGGCSVVTSSNPITITAVPSATISYTGNPFCKSVATAQAVTITGTGAFSGGTYDAPAGLTINSATGAITPSTSTAGTYTVTYSKPAADGCAAISATVLVTITAVPTATISYPGAPFCTTVSTTQGVTLNGTGAYTGGTYSAPAGLTINSANGAITPNTSTAGTYTVTYTMPASAGCAASSATTSVTITASPTATISYAGNPFCATVSTFQPVTLTGTGAYTGGAYSAPTGLTINSSGSVRPSTSTPGTYTVTYTTPASGGCAAVIATTAVTITAQPTASISYSGTPFCTTVNTAQAVTLTGSGANTGGTFSAPAGLSINGSNSGITPSGSTPGTYTVTYTLPAAGGCALVTATTPVTITALPTVSLSYPGSPYCKSLSTGQNPTLTGTGAYNGGSYTAAPAGLTISSSTGAITPSSSTAGTYTVTYTTPASGGCAAVTTTASVTITALPVATFSYTGSPYCQNATNPSPTFSGGGVAGTFTASAGLVFVNSATGEIDLASSTAGTYTVTNTIAASNGCAAVTAAASITISSVPTASITYAGNPFCKSVSTAQSVTLTGTGAFTGGTFSSSPAGLTINSSTGAITPSSSTAGTYTITYSKGATGGCSAISTTTTVTITAAPTAAISYPAASFCTGITTTKSETLTGTGAFSGGTFSASPAGLSINSANGDILPSGSTAGTYTITYTSPATGGCAAVTANATVTINTSPTITVTPNSAAFCSGNSVTLTASGATSYTWSPATNLSITTGSIVIAYPSVTTTYTVTGTAANGCTGTASVPITVTQSPYGDLSSSPPVCPGSNGGTLTLSNYAGTILRWESSTDGGATWATISNTSTSQSYFNLTTTTIYRVYLGLNGCFSYSSVGIVPVNPPFTPTVTATPTIFCLGGSSTLHASDYGAPPFPVEDFQSANPAGWSGNDANNNNKSDNSDWGESGNGKSWNGVVYNSNAVPTNSKFMIVNGDGGGGVTSLITPPFSLVGLTNPIFNYYTALNFSAGTTGWVEVSTDGGNTYTTLKTYTGPTNVGNPNNAWTQESINLSAYIGQSNVRVRFRYSGTAGSNWALDNVGLSGTYQPVTYQWSPLTYITPSNGVGQNVTTTPTVAGTYNYCVVATTAAGCASSPVCVDVTAKPIPTCSIAGNNTVCPGSTNVYSAPAIAGYTYNWTISGGATISGSATGQTVTVKANSTCGSYTLSLATTLNGCSSAPCTQIVNVVDNTAPVATAPATQSFQCLADVPAPGTLTATDNCSGNITATGVDVRVANGCGYTITRTWTFTDACNNTASVSQIINVQDNIPPVITCPPAQIFCEVNGKIYTIPPATASDNCSGALTITYQVTGAITRNGTGTDASGIFNIGVSTITWTVTDACGNTSSCTTLVTINAKPAPIITHN